MIPEYRRPVSFESRSKKMMYTVYIIKSMGQVPQGYIPHTDPFISRFRVLPGPSAGL